MQLQPTNQTRFIAEPGVWVFIFFDLCIFALYFWVFAWGKSNHNDMYVAGQASLNQFYGGVNTLVLLTSSYFMAAAVRAARNSNIEQYTLFIKLTLAGGFAFLIIKVFEYSEKLDAGFNIITNEFYRNYFSFTGFHLLHVFFGIGFLTYLLLGIKTQEQARIKEKHIEGVGIYWHMVDLLWLVLFSLIYLAP